MTKSYLSVTSSYAIALATTNKRTYICMCVNAYAYVCMSLCMYVCMHAYMFVYMHVYMYVWLHRNTYIHIHACLDMYMYVYVYICRNINVSNRFPNCLWAINTRLLELPHWTARLHRWTYPEDYRNLFILLNNVNNDIKKMWCHLMFISSCHKMANIELHYLLFNEDIWGNHWEEEVGLSGISLQSNSSNCLVLIQCRQLGNHRLITTAQHICKSLYQSMFDTYQQID